MIHALEEQFDVGYMSDKPQAAVYVDDAEEAQLRARGYKVGKTLEDHGSWEARKAEIGPPRPARRWRASFAQNGLAKSGVTDKGKRIVPMPGETVIMRAYTFTNYAGPLPVRRGPQQGPHEQRRPVAWRSPTRALTASTATPSNDGRSSPMPARTCTTSS